MQWGEEMNVAVMGATGYAGQELVRRILRRPDWRLVAATARSEVGASLGDWYVRRDLANVFVPMEEVLACQPDLVFNALPHQVATTWIYRMAMQGIRVIDLSADFRFGSRALYESIYGVHPAPLALEMATTGYADDPAMDYGAATIVGNPGCYPTAFFTLMGPIRRAGIWVDPVIVDGKSGVTGAGRRADVSLSMAEMAENVESYSGPGKHRHTAEMEAVTGGRVVFQPHLMPMARGMLVTVYWPNPGVSAEDVIRLWREFYRDTPFVEILMPGRAPRTGRVGATNRIEIMAMDDVRGGTMVLIAAQDNLGKGAAGQAIQHANRWHHESQELGLLD